MNSDRLLIEIVRLDYFSQELDFVAANPVHVEFIVSTEVLLSSKSASNWKKGKHIRFFNACYCSSSSLVM